MILDFLYCIGGMCLSCFVFDAIFYALNKSVLNLFVPLQVYFSKIKQKKFLKIIIYVLLLFLSISIKDNFTLSYFVFGIISGMFYSFVNILFKSGVVNK